MICLMAWSCLISPPVWFDALSIAYLNCHEGADDSTPSVSFVIMYGLPPSLRKTLAIRSRDLAVGQTTTTHPPPPAPVSLAPSAPARFAVLTRRSSLGCETPILRSSS